MAASRASDDPTAQAWLEGARFYWATYVEWDPWLRLCAARRMAEIFQAAGDLMNVSMARVHEVWAYLALGGHAEAEAGARRLLALGAEGIVADHVRSYLGRALAARGAFEE